MRKQSRKAKKIGTNIYCAFGQHFHWIIADAFSISKLLFSCFCHPLILQLCLFNLSNVPVRQKDAVTNSLIKCEAWKTMIYNGNISFQATAVKMEFKLYWVLWYKTTLEKIRSLKDLKNYLLPNLSSSTYEQVWRVFLNPQLYLKYCSLVTFFVLPCAFLPFSIFCSVPWSNLSFKYQKHLIIEEEECLLMILIYPSWIVQ